MIEIRHWVNDEQADALEVHFLEGVRSPWMLQQDRPGELYRLSGYFDCDNEALKAWAELRESFSKLPEVPEQNVLEDADWKESYKRFLQPWYHRDLAWLPLWQRDGRDVEPGRKVLWIDAGLAFGTGSHETTRLCVIRMLEYRDAIGEEAFADSRIVDAGCGTGILALSAALYGARDLYAFDRDPEAMRVCTENAAINGLAGVVRFEEADVGAALNQERAGLLMANIQADVLTLYRDELLAAVLPGGWLVLSGILARECDEVREAFRDAAGKAGRPVDMDSRVDGEWADLRLIGR